VRATGRGREVYGAPAGLDVYMHLSCPADVYLIGWGCRTGSVGFHRALAWAVRVVVGTLNKKKCQI
jgi:hypothetical protein